ncbi:MULTISPECIES: ATP-binding protein [unclassified Nocardioides]|uniref:ATP-binding protein n=1 Tax=unclassified Nocardioides TaxID=2615069 RepID=UPI00361523C1
MDRYAEGLFRGVFETAPDATVIVDTAATIVVANKRFHEVLGYDLGDLVGQSVTVLAAQPDADVVLRGLAEYMREPAAVPMGYTREFLVRHCDGHDVPMELALSPFESEDGLLVIIALRDTTERRRLQTETQRLRDDLIATVSHELRTPLTSIIGYTELMSELGEEDLSRRARKYLGVIERNAVRELQLVDDLLTMAYLDDDRVRMLREQVDLAKVCQRVVDDHAGQAIERGLVLAFDDGDGEPAVGDFVRLVQVVENLVSNGIKFTPAGGRVDICLADQGAMAVVEVRDTGVGVPPEELNRLFERLYRGPHAIANQVQGAGLGLPIVRAIVEAHGGWVDIQSEVGVGTVVRVAIPHFGAGSAEEAATTA